MTIVALFDLVLRVAITLFGITAAECIADRRPYRLSLAVFVTASCVTSVFVFAVDHTKNARILAAGLVLTAVGTWLIARASESDQVRKVLGLSIVLSLYLNIFLLVGRLAEILFTPVAERELKPEFVILQLIAMLAVGAWSNKISRRITDKSDATGNDRRR